MNHIINSVEFKDVSFAFEGQDLILDKASLEFPLGEIISLKGNRGAGRSTLLQILAGIQMPNQGEFLINGRNVLDISFEDFLPYRLKIGYAFDLGGLISNKTLMENLLLPLTYHQVCPVAEAFDRVEYYVHKFGLQKSQNMRPANVSGGVRKLTCLVRSILLNPEILILDDPTVGLPRAVVDQYCETIFDLRRANENHTVIFSSYDDSFARQIETAALYLEEGQIYARRIEKEVANL